MMKIKDKFMQEVWQRDVHALGRSRQIGVYWVRVMHVVVQDIMSGELALRATSLAYTSMLSLVPLLAFAFALLKGFGLQNKLQPLLLDMFSPLGDKGVEIAGKVIDFVNNVRAGALGTFGLILLLYTVISLVRKVERDFNRVWRVQEARTVAEGFGHYLSVIMIGPLLFVAALGITATFSSKNAVEHIIDWAPAGVLLVALGHVIPYIMVIGTFTFIYMFVPHTHVQFRSAFAGAVFAGVLWELSGWAFAYL
ncbi:MAG TPA: YihY/virulence factor BrkB family protein, partial [Gammaproteobacteria bacterium]|nr:YihY/virulence factor BrkB family protein [Gammaproteobacteria bacterium]